MVTTRVATFSVKRQENTRIAIAVIKEFGTLVVQPPQPLPPFRMQQPWAMQQHRIGDRSYSCRILLR